jgi:hypothetical protein
MAAFQIPARAGSVEAASCAAAAAITSAGSAPAATAAPQPCAAARAASIQPWPDDLRRTVSPLHNGMPGMGTRTLI